MKRHLHLLACWAQVARKLRSAERLALFLDFDGTLVPLRERPEQVRLDDTTRRVLRCLAGHRRVTVWIISGRRWVDLRRRVPVAGLRYLGIYGWERHANVSPTGACAQLLRRARRRIVQGLAGLSGVWIEDKGLSFAVHYRAAEKAVIPRARALVRRALKPLQSELRLLGGKKVWEVLPRQVAGKGAAVRSLLAGLSASAFPIYIGDDASDEPAFAALRHGLTARVGAARRTRARYRLRNPREVREFLERLEAEIACGPLNSPSSLSPRLT